MKGERHYIWRAVDHEGTVLDVVVSKKRDKKSALNVLKRLLKNYVEPILITTDKFRSMTTLQKF